jgi:hypothetical protein
MMQSIGRSKGLLLARGLAPAVALLLAGAATPVLAAASIIDKTSTIFAGGITSMGYGTGFNRSIVNYTRSATAGGIEGSDFLGYYGATLTGTVGARINGNGNVGLSNTITSLFSGSSSLLAGGANQVGGAFVLRNDINITKTTVFSGKGVINADLNATMFAGANVSGNVCGVFCTGETSIVSLGIGDPRELKIIGYNSGSNTVTFLGKTTSDALPKSFPAAGGLPVSAMVNAVNLSAKGVGGQSAGLQTSQEVAGVYVDVAGALANAFGIPGALLSGSALGFDYNVISAKVGFGINLAYQVVTSVIDTATRYTFSGKVERLDPTTGLYKSVGQSLTLRDNELAILRAPGQANLGIMPETLVTTQTLMTTDVGLSLNANLRLLELHGNGLNFGPLFAASFSTSLGSLKTLKTGNIFTSKGSNGWVNLGFDSGGFARAGAQISSLSDGAAALADDVGAVGIGSAGFVFDPTETTGDTISGFVTSGFVRRVTNYGTRGCDDFSTIACIFDDRFVAIPQARRTTISDTGEELVDYSSDFTAFSAIDPLDVGAFGEQSTPESLMASLMALPGPESSYALPFISDGSSPLTAVPEPGTWAMLIMGFGLLGGALRRRRDQNRGLA